MVRMQSILAAMMVVMIAAPLRGEEATSDLSWALRRIEEASAGLKSLRVTVAFRTVNGVDPTGKPREVVFDELWQGEHWRMERNVTAPGKTGLERTEAFDGKSHYLLVTADQLGMVVEKKTSPAEGWNSIFESPHGAWGIIQPARQLLEAGWIASRENPGKRLLAVRWTQESVSHEMRLDPTVDYQPRWWRMVRKPGAAGSPVQSVTKTVMFEEYVASREFWFVSKGKESIETVMKDGRSIAREVSFDVIRVEANPDVAKGAFRIDYPKGVTFFVGEKDRFRKRQ